MFLFIASGDVSNRKLNSETIINYLNYSNKSVHKNYCFSSFRDTHLYPKCLRSITVRIISLAECQSHYLHDPDITDKTICTFNGAFEATKHCSDGDSGGPLVLNGKLIGVMAWNREDINANAPDVFMNLAHPEYRNWIISNMPQNSSNPLHPSSSCSPNPHHRPNQHHRPNPHYHPNPHQQPFLRNNAIRRM